MGPVIDFVCKDAVLKWIDRYLVISHRQSYGASDCKHLLHVAVLLDLLPCDCDS